MSTKKSKPCVACAEEIQESALLCRYCQTDQRDIRFLESGIGQLESNDSQTVLTNPDADSWDVYLSTPNYAREKHTKPIEKSGEARSNSKVLASGLVLGTLGVVLLFLFGNSLNSNDSTNSLRQESYQIGIEAGKSLKAQNRQLLFYDPARECAEAFTLYSVGRDLDFDRFLAGCKYGWN